MSEHHRPSKTRGYEMGKRAEDVDRTRRRIVEAAVHLHGTRGPAATSISAIAERAGVTRLTVYRHFPDEVALFTACSGHWMSQQTPPRPDAWATVTDPVERLRAGLTDLYRFYREGEPMLTLVIRDRDAVPDPIRRTNEEQERRYVQVLTGTAPADAHHRIRQAVVGHAVSFSTWRSLCREQGLDDDEAVHAMVKLVESVTGPRIGEPRSGR